VSAYLDRPIGQRAVSLGVVVLLHVVLGVVILSSSGATRFLAPVIAQMVVLPKNAVPPPPPPPIEPKIPPPDLLPIPMPEIAVAPPPSSASAPRAIVRVGPKGPPVSHFGSANGDTGLGLALAASGTGGAQGRGNLGDFEAAVKRAVLQRKVQPVLAWDRRNTCVVNYTVKVARDGALAGFQIDPCAIPEINEAARTAIQQAAPFPRPPDLGGATYDVHGTLIFHP
jgi:protein TonB